MGREGVQVMKVCVTVATILADLAAISKKNHNSREERGAALTR
jgi:hypothetical protein